ncbi:hypothetical protein V6N13_009140 [Hibiscus sabdariffa]|uniref:Ubiquinol-cytochrome C reductase hinge domain-containing protein n=1 Tax=Hibiscus sabdariffa TaxID=183260 RepID=A0ABR2DH90_9ROSI
MLQDIIPHRHIRYRTDQAATLLIGRADEEPVDQKKTLENICQSGCAKPKHGYEECVKRISGDDTGTKHCTGQYFDYLTCVDKCVAPKLFAKLK